MKAEVEEDPCDDTVGATVARACPEAAFEGGKNVLGQLRIMSRMRRHGGRASVEADVWP